MKCQVRLSARSFSKSSLQCSFHVFDLLLSAPASGECLFGARVADLTDKVPHMMTIGPIAPLSDKEAMMSSSKTIPTLHPYHHVFGKRQVADETGGRYCQDFLASTLQKFPLRAPNILGAVFRLEGACRVNFYKRQGLPS